MVWLPDGEKNLKIPITRFDRMYERDRYERTDRQTPHDDTGRACIASGGQNALPAGRHHECDLCCTGDLTD